MADAAFALLRHAAAGGILAALPFLAAALTRILAHPNTPRSIKDLPELQGQAGKPPLFEGFNSFACRAVRSHPGIHAGSLDGCCRLGPELSGHHGTYSVVAELLDGNSAGSAAGRDGCALENLNDFTIFDDQEKGRSCESFADLCVHLSSHGTDCDFHAEKLPSVY
jgi:hypothetical protein